MLTFRQSESTATRRRWMFQLIGANVTNETPSGSKPGTSFTLAYLPDPNTLILTNNGQVLAPGGIDFTLVGQAITTISTVGATDVFKAAYSVPALTGQSGTGYITKNGATAVATTNSMVEIDSANMPGFYYIELTATELNAAGFLGLRVKTTQSLNYEDKALITYDDPYAFHGGFPVGSLGKNDTQKLNWKKLMEMIKQAVKEEMILLPQDNVQQEKLDRILECVTELEQREETETDFQPVLQAISGIKIPKPNDYSKDFKGVLENLKNLNQTRNVDVEGFSKAVKDFENKMAGAAEYVVTTTKGFQEIQQGFIDLKVLFDKFQATLSDQSDMDKRFDSLAQAANNKKIEELTQMILDLKRQLMTALVNYKFDVLQQLKK